jgi:hypothetical protein
MAKRIAPIQSCTNSRCRRPVAPAALVLAGVLAGCGDGRGSPGQVTASGESGGEAAYRPPPEATFSQRLAGGAVVLGGSSDPGTRVRLASPGGTMTPAVASGHGAWRARLPARDSVRLFGLAANEHGRTVQSDGYLAVTPGGLAAQLRAGAGARVIASKGPLRILSVDFDRKGGVVMSGIAAPREAVSLRADGAVRGRVLADGDGRFTFPFDEPLKPGIHNLEAVDGAAHSAASVALTPPAPLTAGPYRATHEADGWRIDWLTPGGGAQATLLLNPEEPNT